MLAVPATIATSIEIVVMVVSPPLVNARDEQRPYAR